MPKLAARARCHCGSGKAYKDCHMAEDQAREEEQRAWDAALFALRREFIEFAREERFAEVLAEGLRLFWDGRYTVQTAHQMNEDEALRFFDWFVMDHAPAGGRRLLDVYAAEKAAELDERERELLRAHEAERPASAYAVAAIDRPRLQLRDVFTAAETWIEDAFAAREIEIGDVLLARVLPVGELRRAAGGAARLPADEAGDLLPEMARARETYLAEQADMGWDDFLRSRGYLLTHYAMRQAEAHGRPAIHPTNVAGELRRRSVQQLRRLRGR